MYIQQYRHITMGRYMSHLNYYTKNLHFVKYSYIIKNSVIDRNSTELCREILHPGKSDVIVHVNTVFGNGEEDDDTLSYLVWLLITHGHHVFQVCLPC